MVPGCEGSMRTEYAGAFTRPVEPAPEMSAHVVPPAAPALMVCHTRPTLKSPMLTQASAGLAGLKVIPLIQGLGKKNVDAVACGRLPVMFVQVAASVVR